MPGGTCPAIAELPERHLHLLLDSSRGFMSTMGRDGFPHSVPCVYVIEGSDIVSPIDAKPKTGRDLARVRNIEHNPVATLVVDQWDEDWNRLAWVMVRARARLEPLESRADMIRTRYPQYDALEMSPGDRGIILSPARISWWEFSPPG